MYMQYKKETHKSRNQNKQSYLEKWLKSDSFILYNIPTLMAMSLGSPMFITGSDLDLWEFSLNMDGVGDTPALA